MLMIISVFGAMLLLPLYLQAVRGESALRLRPAARPAGHRRDDRDADRRPADRQDRRRQDRASRACSILLASTLGLTQLTGDTSYWTLSAVLFVMGVGMGFSMMPLMSGAMQTLRRVQVARASHDAEHHPAGRRLDRHRGHVRDPHGRAAGPPRRRRRRGHRPRRDGRGPAAAGPRPDGERVRAHLLVGGRADRPGDPRRAPAAARQARADRGRRARAPTNRRPCSCTPESLCAGSRATRTAPSRSPTYTSKTGGSTNGSVCE